MWRLEGNTAKWQCDRLGAELELAEPARGLIVHSFGDQQLPHTALMQMHLQAVPNGSQVTLEDCYVRGNELVARYVVGGDHLRPEICWRMGASVTASPDVFIMEALVSTQTDLLDSDPTIRLQCQLAAQSCHVFAGPNGEASRSLVMADLPQTIAAESRATGCGLVVPLTGCPIQFAQIFDWADVVRAQLEENRADNGMSASVSFFGGRVEKGVIRRTRIRVMLAPEQIVRDELSRQWCELLESPPPLAT